MKYDLLQKMMWSGYKSTFKKHLSVTLKETDPNAVMKAAYKKYKEILLDVDEFDRSDRFIFNILSCAMLASILLTLKNKCSIEEVRAYYRGAMCDNFLTKAVSKKGMSYTVKGRELLKKQAEKSKALAAKNPYTWRFAIEDGKTINQYTATFYTCGICYLMTKLGLKEYIPAMCTLDYDMALLGNTEFTREHTLAGEGKYCDCHYNHKGKCTGNLKVDTPFKSLGRLG
mgnify:CR=1 FL=1